jgi:hypothetical protein
MPIMRLLSMQPMIFILFLVVAYCLHISINHQPSITSIDPYHNVVTTTASSDSLVERNSAYSIASQLNNLPLEDKTWQGEIQNQIRDGEYKQAQTLLLEMAANAVELEDKSQLFDVMLLLADVSSAEQGLEMTEVYLMEVLDIATLADDQKAVARSYQQLGLMHIKSREIARTASNTNDDLWIIRRQIYLEQYRDVTQNLQQVIDSNLSIRRYGAAASAYETLPDYYRTFSDDYLSLQAAAQAAKLYASSGRIDRSREIIARFSQDQIAPAQVMVINSEINQLYQQYRNDFEQTAQARQYQELYYYYKNQGQYHRAWNLRILASKSQVKSSTRLMYQRQTDVMAILYNSNFAMDKARDYLQQASQLFETQGEEDLYADTQWMKSLIY